MTPKKPANPQEPMQSESSGQKSGALSRDIQAKIGQQLRAAFDDIVQEGVPDRFVELLRQLDKKSGEGKSE